MKRIIALLMSILLLVFPFSACGSGEADETITLTVLTEEDFVRGAEDESITKLVNYLYPNIEVEFVSLPIDPSEREPALTNLRTEIMSGKGPDIYLLSTWNSEPDAYDRYTGEEIDRIEPLFRDVNDAMNNMTFLPLDDYIAGSEYINMDDHLQVVMDAGKNEFGQVVMPLMYSVDMFLADKELLRDPDVELDSLDALVSYTDKQLRATVNMYMERWFSGMFADITDPISGKLLLTEEAIIKAFEYSGILFDSPSGGKNITYDLEISHDSAYYIDMMYYTWMSYESEVKPIVIHNMNGGVTAQIEVFAAINGNTEYPDEAFKVLEILFRDETQSNDFIDTDYAENGERITLVPDLFGRDEGILTGDAATSNELMYNPDQVAYVESLIIDARFTSEYDCMLTDAWSEVNNKYYWNSQKSSIDYHALIEEVAAELYSDFKMMAAE